jgi:hypothetical protein
MKLYREEVIDAWIYVIETLWYDNKNATKDDAFKQFVTDLLHYYPCESDIVMERLDYFIKKEREGKR